MKITNNFLTDSTKVCVLLAALAIQACATNPVTGRSDFVMMSEQQEVNLGKSYHQQILKEYSIYEAPGLQAYVDRIGQDLATNSHRPQLDWTFTLLDSPEVNAFATPGGYVYITRGIMAYMQDEADLAGVIGHEIGHVTARHGVRQQAQSTLAGIGTAAVAVATGSGELANLTSQLSTAMVRGYGRTYELQSDGLGAEYLAHTGYDPQNMIDVVRVLKNQELFELELAREEGREPRVYHGVFSTHPDNDTRLREVVAAAEQFKSTTVTRPDDGDFLLLADGMAYGPSESQGIVQGNALYHKAMDFTVNLPEGWTLHNLPDRIVGVSGNETQIIQILPANLEGKSGQAFLAEQFTDFSGGEVLNLSGAQGYTGLASVDAGSGQRLASRVAVVNRAPAPSFQMAGYGENQVPNNAVLYIARSIRSLNAEEQKLATGKKIVVISARRGDTFAKLAQESVIDKYAEQKLRLLNNMYPDGEPAVGQLIKTVTQ
ncbi:MAG: M48 family metalloprotease [Proteobacteria bacterium]|jgi:predicted Zn-dependent protease|nr:M48 family metalloprotease [Pseudomonadota bacterium]